MPFSIILAIYPTGITIGNGQLILFLLPCILTAVLMERGRDSGIVKDIFISALFLFSLLKIPVTAPFFLIPLINQTSVSPFIPCGLRLYLIPDLRSNVIPRRRYYRDTQSGQRIVRALAMKGDTRTFTSGSDSLGLKQLMLPASLVLISAFSLWLYKFRNVDIWHLSSASRLSSPASGPYHRLIRRPADHRSDDYDFQELSRSGQLSRNESLAADLLLVVPWLGLLSPGSFLQLPLPYRHTVQIAARRLYGYLCSFSCFITLISRDEAESA